MSPICCPISLMIVDNYSGVSSIRCDTPLYILTVHISYAVIVCSPNTFDMSLAVRRHHYEHSNRLQELEIHFSCTYSDDR